MIDPEKLFAGEGGYVFVSHSHQDIKEVRLIRNFLEAHGLEPILFYLRSMDDGDTTNEQALKKLIFDEIDAREFFLYVNSENAQISKWVQDELDHVRKKDPQKITVLDLKHDGIQIDKWLESYVKRVRIFISHSRKDSTLAARIREVLLLHDYRVYDMQDKIRTEETWNTSVSHMIAEVAEAGRVLLLVTPSSLQSPAVMQEVQIALRLNAVVLPIVVGEAAAFYDWSRPLYRLPEDPSDEDLHNMAKYIRLMK